MRILEMTATFGGLDRARLTPGPGLTLIEGPNEGGKSTWCAFLRAMFYGFPARDRDRGDYLAEKNRYQPWSGRPMEGTVRLEWRGRQLTLRRGPRGTTPWGDFSAVFTATQEPVPGLTGENCGQVLLGVPREVFERTAFLGQGGGGLTPSGELEKRIAALAGTGEETVSYAQAEGTLRSWRNRRRVNAKVGLIPQLEEELAQTQAALERQGELLARQQTAQRLREEGERQAHALQKKLWAHADYRSALQRESRAQAQRELEEAQARLAQTQAALQDLPDREALLQGQADLKYLNALEQERKGTERALPQLQARQEETQELLDRDPWFSPLPPDRALAQAQADHDRAAADPKGPPLALWLLASLALLIGVGLAGAALLELIPTALRGVRLLPVGAGLAGLGALILLILSLVRRRAERAQAAQTAALLEKYAVQAPQGILDRADRYREKAQAAQEAGRQLRETQAQLDKLTARRDELTGQLFALVRPFAPQVKSLFGVSAALSKALQQGDWAQAARAKAQAARQVLSALPQDDGEPAPDPAAVPPPDGEAAALAARLREVTSALDRAREEEARLRGELAASGDPAELSARADRLREELALRREEYDALTLALEALRAADDRRREKFSPALNARAGEYLAALTGGRYTAASLTRQFQALAARGEGEAPRRDLVLSAGTAQQLYLALRLALCDLALPREEPCPLLLDDTLDPFDDDRARLALDCLLRAARDRQILLFTCHSREGRFLQGTEATLLRMEKTTV